MAKFNERLSEAMQIKGITQAELCKRTGIGKSAMSQYISGKFNPKQTRTYLIANALNVSIPWLMGADVPMEEQYDDLTPLSNDNVYMRPLYESVAAGFGAPAVNQIISYIPTYIHNASEKDKYIWVRVQGDSMFPKIEDGDKILIRLQDSVDSGQVGIVLIDGEEAVVKKINYDTDYIELISFNPYYPPRRFEGADVQRIRVVGLVREVNKELQ